MTYLPIKAAFDEARGPIEIARIAQSMRNGRTPHTPSWAQLARDITGQRDGPDQSFWYSRLIAAVLFAYVEGEPVALRRASIICAEKRLRPLSPLQRERLWSAIMQTTDDAALKAAWRRGSAL